MFKFVVKNLGFLKSVPVLPLFFDGLLRLQYFFTKPQLLTWLDEIEAEVSTWDGTTLATHKYGGSQFNFNDKEIGHIHSNGLLDILFNVEIKRKLIAEGRVCDHQVFLKSGWLSFYLKCEDDVVYAKKLLLMSYLQKKQDVKQQ